MLRTPCLAPSSAIASIFRADPAIGFQVDRTILGDRPVARVGVHHAAAHDEQRLAGSRQGLVEGGQGDAHPRIFRGVQGHDGPDDGIGGSRLAAKHVEVGQRRRDRGVALPADLRLGFGRVGQAADVAAVRRQSLRKPAADVAGRSDHECRRHAGLPLSSRRRSARDVGQYAARVRAPTVVRTYGCERGPPRPSRRPKAAGAGAHALVLRDRLMARPAGLEPTTFRSAT